MVNKSKGNEKAKAIKKEKTAKAESIDDGELNEIDEMQEAAFDEDSDPSVCSAICWIPRINNKPMQFKKLNKSNQASGDVDLPSDDDEADGEEKDSDDDMEDDSVKESDKNTEEEVIDHTKGLIVFVLYF